MIGIHCIGIIACRLNGGVPTQIHCGKITAGVSIDTIRATTSGCDIDVIEVDLTFPPCVNTMSIRTGSGNGCSTANRDIRDSRSTAK